MHTLPSTDHRHLSKEERTQALAVIAIAVKLMHGRVPRTVEQSLHEVAEFLQRYGQANNRPVRKRHFKEVRENLVAIAEQGAEP